MAGFDSGNFFISSVWQDGTLEIFQRIQEKKDVNGRKLASWSARRSQFFGAAVTQLWFLVFRMIASSLQVD